MMQPLRALPLRDGAALAAPPGNGRGPGAPIAGAGRGGAEGGDGAQGGKSREGSEGRDGGAAGPEQGPRRSQQRGSWRCGRGAAGGAPREEWKDGRMEKGRNEGHGAGAPPSSPLRFQRLELTPLHNPRKNSPRRWRTGAREAPLCWDTEPRLLQLLSRELK